MKPNAIILCCTANWLPYAAATLLSCVQQGASDVADLYVSVIGAKPADNEKFENFTKSHGFAVRMIDAKLPPILDEFPALRFSSAALLRLTLDEILPRAYTRVLYLDCDILAESPVADIFKVNLNGKALGAVEDYQSLPGPLALLSSHTQTIGLATNAPYFNSGVLLFDWGQTCKGQYLPRCMARIIETLSAGPEMKQGLKLPDQDVLNLEFAGHWQRLDLRFNLMAFFVDYFPAPSVFRHFSNRQKPWGKLWQPGFSRYRKFYHETFASSPWPDYVPGPYTRPSIEGTLGIALRKLDPISGHRYRKHLERV